jgi:hypothetical protein
MSENKLEENKHFKKLYNELCEERDKIITGSSYEKIRKENKYILRTMIAFGIGFSIGMLLLWYG